MELTHASFFSGVGGLDLGLERAGWRTVSFSEIDPYADAVLASRWPGVPNLGSITDFASGRSGERSGEQLRQHADHGGRSDAAATTLWTGGFPCQDLSVAGKRAGLAGERSGLAFAFLDLVERHQPRWLLLENVPGLLSSHGGADLAALACRVADLGYGMAYRVLDARHYGVPQRRRRVFILATNAPGGRAGAERAAEVLALAAGGGGHPAAGGEAGPGAAPGAQCSPDGIVGQAVSSKWAKQAGGPAGDEHHNLVVGAPADPRGMRAADELAGRLDDPGGVAFVKGKRARSVDDDESWRADDVAPTLNSFDVGDTRATTLAPTLNSNRSGGWRYDPDQAEGLQVAVADGPDDPLLPLGLDSHRYRVIGNGVVANVAEEIGRALRYVVEREP